MPQQSYADVMRAGAAFAEQLAPLAPFTHGTFLNHYDGGDSPLNGLRVLTVAEVEAMAAQPPQESIVPVRPTNSGKVYRMGEPQPTAAAPRLRVA